jgi:hypothetical protein
MGPRAGLDGLENGQFLALPRHELRLLGPVAIQLHCLLILSDILDETDGDVTRMRGHRNAYRILNGKTKIIIITNTQRLQSESDLQKTKQTPWSESAN